VNHVLLVLILRHQVQLLVPYAFLDQSQQVLVLLLVLFVLLDPTLRHHKVQAHHYHAHFALSILFLLTQALFLVLFVSLVQRAIFLNQVVRLAQPFLGISLILSWQFQDGNSD